MRTPTLVSAFLSFAAIDLARPPEASAQDHVIYYDWVDPDGTLRGGRILADPEERLHTAQVAATVPTGSPFTTIVQNGPSANRVDLVIVGDGYAAGELAVYDSDVGAVLAPFFAEFPLDAYASFFNVHRVDVVSNESGVDNDPVQGIVKDTAMDMGFWRSGIERLLCINVGKAQNEAANAPDVDQILALANSSKYGGAGYTGADLATLAGQNSLAVELALHECGHSVADLADEYDYGDGATYSGPEPSSPNVSSYLSPTMAALGAKWHVWLGDANVGTFEGASYYQFGLYRPTVDSKMRSLNRPFEQINAEQFIVTLYQTVRPIDAATPPGKVGPNATLFVTPVQPVSHALDVQWYLDGQPIPGAQGTQLDLSALVLPQGSSQVSVVVVDGTSWVRDEALRA